MLPNEKIAIVGMACRLPLANSIDAYWENLIAGRVCTHQKRHWPEGQVVEGGFLDDIKSFDAAFFNISPLEAKCMSPQLRHLLEVSYQAIDTSGISIEVLRKLRTGVFTTALPGDYKNLLAKDPETATSTHSFLGNAPSAMSGRLSYYYNFHGPSLNIDTACSSGLSTLNVARLSMLNDECDAALIGGASIFSTSELHQLAEKSQLLSKKSQCFAFDEKADGFVPAEAVVVLVLMKASLAKSLSLLEYALIDSLTLNHDGLSNGLMAPNARQQAELVRACYQEKQGILDELAIIESHGTGTQLGDPIELKGLSDAFSHFPLPQDRTYLGASKMIVGHSLVCSSLSSIVKLILAYEHQKIPPNPLYKKANPHGGIPDFLEMNKDAVPWPDGKFYAGVSAFGFTGSNAHLLLKFNSTQPPLKPHDFESYFLFSAPDNESLIQVLLDIKQWLEARPSIFLPELSARLIRRAQHFRYRLAIYAEHLTDLIKALEVLSIRENLQLDKNKEKNLFYKVGEVEENSKAHRVILRWLSGDSDAFSGYQIFLNKLKLPNYPFKKIQYWVGSSEQVQSKESKGFSVLTIVKKGLAQLLSYQEDDIDDSKTLLELGLDSLTAVQLVNFLKNHSIEVGLDSIWDATSLIGFANKLKFKELSDHALVNDSYLSKLNLIKDKRQSLIWFVSQEEGKPLLLLPPLNCDYHAWIRQIPLLHQLRYQVHIPLYPGHHPGAKVQKISLNKIAEEIASHVAFISGGEMHFVGWSLGGILSLLVALHNPGCMKSMTLISSAAHFDLSLFEKTLEMQAELKAKEEVLKIAFQTNQPINDFISAKAPMTVLKEYYEALMNISVSEDQLNSIRIPTQLIYGENDPVVDLSQIDFLKKISGAHCTIYPEGGHFIPINFAAQFNDQLFGFIQQMEKKASYETI